MIKLCYKEYRFKMSLGAMKQFKEKTGKDLWFTLMSFYSVFLQTAQIKSTTERMRHLYSCCDFDTGAEAFHALMCAVDKVGLDEIRDGMFRVGWLPSERPDSMSEPWPLVMVEAFLVIDEQFKEIAQEKKSDTSDQKTA